MPYHTCSRPPILAGVEDLSRWLDDDSDLVYYLRDWNHEITAGNYIIRNTEFSRSALQLWSSFNFHTPTGFHSSDNGAIHLVFLQYVGIQAPHCYKLYRELTATTANLVPYYTFVACTRRALGQWFSTMLVSAFYDANTSPVERAWY